MEDVENDMGDVNGDCTVAATALSSSLLRYGLDVLSRHTQHRRQYGEIPTNTILPSIQGLLLAREIPRK
jgi:hypothetical protein